VIDEYHQDLIEDQLLEEWKMTFLQAKATSLYQINER
jgi:hypothetical protein